MFSFFLHHDRRKSYPSSRDKWLCKQASSHLSLWTTKSIAFAKDFLPEKTCKLLRRLLYRNGFVLCSILASPIFVWRNGVWQRRKLLRKRHMRNVRTTCWLDSITRTASGIEDDCFPQDSWQGSLLTFPTVMEKRNAVRLVPCQARLAERIRVWLGVNPDSFGCSYVLASWAQEEKFSSSFSPENPYLYYYENTY